MSGGLKKRWHVAIDYGNAGEIIDIEELSELHDIIEHGPDWNLISNIEITLNTSRRVKHPFKQGGDE